MEANSMTHPLDDGRDVDTGEDDIVDTPYEEEDDLDEWRDNQ